MGRSKRVRPGDGSSRSQSGRKGKRKGKKYQQSGADVIAEEPSRSYDNDDKSSRRSSHEVREEGLKSSTKSSGTFELRKDSVKTKFSKNPAAQHMLNRRQLASFYPLFLIERLKKSRKISSSTFFADGACMIADISGFVKLCGRLSGLGVDGLDELSKYTNSYIGDLVETVYRYGGDVVSFAGDAIICVFLAQDNEHGDLEGACCQRAVRCSIELKDYESLDLTAHIGVSYGEICFAILGGHQKEWIYLINGECVVELGDALTQAKAKESVITKACHTQCTLFDEEFMDAEELPNGNWKVSSTKEVKVDFVIKKETVNCDKIDLHAFVPPCVNAAVLGGSFTFLSELREVTTMFLLLDSYSPKKNKDLLTLQPFFFGIQKILKQTGGFMRQFLVDDKGCVLIAIWGVPKASHVNNCSRALQACVLISNLCQTTGQQCSIGLTTGDAYCGTVGSPIRQDYVAMGDPVNMAARLMCKAKGRIIVDSATQSMLPKEMASSLNLAESMMLKGKTEPIRPYFYAEDYLAALSNLDAEKSHKIALDSTILIEMTREVDQLAQYQSKVENKEIVLKEGTMPDLRIIQIEGAPGSGKTECANRFVEISKQREIRSIRVKCSKTEQNVSYGIYRKLIVELLGPVNFTTEARQTEAVISMLQYAFPNSDLEDAVKKHFSILKVALGLKWNFSTDKFSFPVFAKLQAFTFFGNKTLSQILAALCQVCCTTLVIEDVHFCDDLSWKEISQALNGLKSPLVVLLTFRQDAEANMGIRRSVVADAQKKGNDQSNGGTKDKKELYTDKTSTLYSGASPSSGRKYSKAIFGAKVAASQLIPKYGFQNRGGKERNLFFKSKYNCKSLSIPMLKYDDVMYIMNTTLEEDVPKHIVETVLEVSGGNAYWVKSISKFIKSCGIEQFAATIQDDSDNGSSGNSHQLRMRKKLERHVVCHLEMFPVKVQTIAKYSALIGDEFNVDVLKEILPESVIENESDLSTSLHTLSEEGIAYPISTSPPVYTFHNEIIRTTLYDFVLPSEAALVHQSIGETIEDLFESDLSRYFASLSYHFAMSPEEQKPRALYYTVRTADQELSQAAFGMCFMYIQYALSFMQYQNELEVVCKLVDAVVAEMTSYRNSKFTTSLSGPPPFSEETFKNFTKLKADLRASLKSHKYDGVDLLQEGHDSLFDDKFLSAIDSAILRPVAEELGSEDMSGSKKKKKKQSGCVVS